jgi:nucleoside-diphosphate-sugar epimerase
VNEIRGRRVLVTGADGFIGSHLVERLVADGARVRVFCLYNSQGSWGWLDEVRSEVRDALDVRLGDIRDARFLEQACQEMEIVLHLAALIAIP